MDVPQGPQPAGDQAPLAPECLVPILGRDNNLIGLLVLGPRLSEEPYSGEDKGLLDSVAAQAQREKHRVHHRGASATEREGE